METILILIRQIAQMFLLAGMGYLLLKSGKITLEGSRALGSILIYLALPAVIIHGFLVERTPERLTGMLYSAAGAAVLLLLSILTARFFFRKDAIAAFAGAFSNPGFFGVPLIVSSLGQGAVFYVACFIAFLNIGQWTYGVSILNGQPIRQGFQPRKLIRAPFIIAILIGLFLFFTQLRPPEVIGGEHQHAPVHVYGGRLSGTDRRSGHVPKKTGLSGRAGEAAPDPAAVDAASLSAPRNLA